MEVFRLERRHRMQDPVTAHPHSHSPQPQASVQPRILVVEDDPDIARLLILHLEDLDAQVKHAERGDDAYALALEQDWDLMILDLRLPGMGGLDICRSLRAQGRLTPILMLTAKSGELDRVLGLELGADDYLSKPFSPLELIARVKAQLRRASMQRSVADGAPRTDGSEDPITVGPFSICTRRHQATFHGETLELTAREFELLLHFVRHPERVFRRGELLDEVWGYGHEGYEHTVNTHINRLRRKVEHDPRNPRHIVTVWGVGYRFQIES
jgi:DNA-binding response OmpR family regulator